MQKSRKRGGGRKDLALLWTTEYDLDGQKIQMHYEYNLSNIFIANNLCFKVILYL